MAFNIARFKSEGLTRDGARPSLFQVELTFPPSVASLATTVKGSFVCSASQLPASLIAEVRVPYFGRFIKVKGDREFQDWPVTVMNDEDFILREAFEAWQDQMNYLESNIEDTNLYPTGYKVDMRIHQFAKDGKPGTEPGGIIRSYVLVGAWPTQIGSINLDWSDTNRIETFDVTFAYDYWIPEGPTVFMGPPF
jgi:hypothetical protein